MKGVMKWAGGLLAFCILGFLGIIVVLPMVLDPNDYKDKISDLLYEQSGFRLEIPGDITLHISPRLDILFSLGQVRVLAAPGHSETPLLSSEEARVELSLFPLLKEKRLVVQGVQLHGVYCYLIRDRSGRGNWETTQASVTSASSLSPSKKKEASLPMPQSPAIEKTKKIPTLELGAFDLSRVTVRYEDQQAAKIFELKDFNAQTGQVLDGKSFHLQSAFTLISSGKKNTTLFVESSLNTDLIVRFSERTLQLDNLSLDNAIKAFGVQSAQLSLAGNAFIDLAKKNISLKEFRLSSGDLSVQLNAEVGNYQDPHFKGTLRIPEFSLGGFLKANKLPQPNWKNDSALRQVGFSCEFAGDMKKIDVSAIDVLLDGAHGTGSFVLTDLRHPSYDFTMHFDRFDVDSYGTVVRGSTVVAGQAEKKEETQSGTIPGEVPAAGTGKVSGTLPVKKAPSLQPVFPVESLRKLRFNLDLAVDSLKVKGAELSHVELKASGRDGQLELNPLRAHLYSGSMAAEAQLDVTGELPRLDVKGDVAQVQVGPLLTDMTGKEEVTGSAVSALRLTTYGNVKEQLIRNSNGTMSLALEDGVVKKLHILDVVRQAKALYEKKPLVQAAKDEPTGFARINASGVVSNGVFRNKDLKAESDLMKVTGAGSVDFVTEYVDYLLNISILRSLDRDDRFGKADYSKFVVPYRIQGEFSNIQEEADVVGLFKAEATHLLMGELQKQLDKKSKSGDSKRDGKNSSAQDLLEQGLKGLFGN